MRWIALLLGLVLSTPIGAGSILVKKVVCDPAYVLEEDFEATSGNSCDSGFSDIAWTDAVESFDCNYATTPAPLLGSYSGRLNIPTATFDNIYHDWGTNSSNDTVYASFIINIDLLGQDEPFVTLQDDSNLDLVRVYRLTGTTNIVVVAFGGTSNNTGFAVAYDTTYYFKIKYVRGTGSNAQGCVSITSNPASGWGTEYCSTNGTRQTYADTLEFGVEDTGNNYIIDKVRASYADIPICVYQ